MARSEDRDHAPQLTARGAATRTRIVQAAAQLMYINGVAATTLDDVLAASGTSKSQLYRHFADKDALVREVVTLRAGEVLARNEQRLRRLDSLRGLTLWRDAVVQRNALHRGGYGCELGSLAAELADRDDDLRITLEEHFRTWEGLLAAGLERMRAAGVLRPEADPAKLAIGIMAALQGGYLLAQTARDVAPMEIALDIALDHVRSFATRQDRAVE